MQRRKFSREFKVEAVKLVRERGVSAALAARDLDVHENVLRKWGKEFGSDPVEAFLPGRGQIQARAAGDRAAPARSQQAEGRARYPKKLSRAVARLRAVETDHAILVSRRVAAVSLLEAR